MSLVIGLAVLAVMMAFSTVYSAVVVVQGMRYGRFVSPFWDARRDDRPMAFWAIFVGYVAIAVCFALLLGDAFL